MMTQGFLGLRGMVRKDLQNFVTSFQNIRVMAKYYTRITLKRMSQLLDLTVDVRNLLLDKTSNFSFKFQCIFKQVQF